MGHNPRCATCNADNREELEAEALRAVAGDISWRQAAANLGLTHGQGLRNHMEQHYHRPLHTVVGESSDYEGLVAGSIEDLKAQMDLAPPELKPLYAVAIQNMKGLHETKPSQQHLIAALKAIHEVTGMRIEQQLLLQYAKHAEFAPAPPPAPALTEAAFEEAEVVEVGDA